MFAGKKDMHSPCAPMMATPPITVGAAMAAFRFVLKLADADSDAVLEIVRSCNWAHTYQALHISIPARHDQSFLHLSCPASVSKRYNLDAATDCTVCKHVRQRQAPWAL